MIHPYGNTQPCHFLTVFGWIFMQHVHVYANIAHGNTLLSSRQVLRSLSGDMGESRGWIRDKQGSEGRTGPIEQWRVREGVV
jgi:hypothetical protein